MATSTFFKRIILDDDACDIIIKGLERPREEFVPKYNFNEELKKGEELLKQVLLELESSPEPN